MRWFHGLVLASCLMLGCAESSPPCEAEGKPFQAEEGAFCLYGADSPLVIEGGFACPSQFGFRFDTEAGIACSEIDLDRLPTDVCARLGAACEDGSEPALPYDAGPQPEPSMPSGVTTNDPWYAVAKERGFLKPLEGSDFFEAMQYACAVDTTERPKTWQQLVDESDRVVLASITEVLVEPEQPPPADEVVDEEVYLKLDVEEAAKGEAVSSVLVQDTCGSGGKVWPLRKRLPSGSFVFFLSTPRVSSEGTEGVTDLMYYYLGVVREDENGVGYALGDDSLSPSLSDFDSLRALLDAVSAHQL